MSILKIPRFPLVCEFTFKCCDINDNGFLLKEEVEKILELVIPCIYDNNIYIKILIFFDVGCVKEE